MAIYPPEDYMRLALAAAQKCQVEESKVNPRVGVVVVRHGEVLAEAYRGELAEGEHAEYTALERKLSGKSVEGADVYTTLEPCIWRNSPKIPCARRLIDRRVGRVFIGMLDPDVRVHGRGMMDLADAGIDVQMFSKEASQGAKALNAEFVRDRRARYGFGTPVGEPVTVGSLRIVTRTLNELLPGHPPTRVDIRYPEVSSGMSALQARELNSAFEGTAIAALHELRRLEGARRNDPEISETGEDLIERGLRVTLADHGFLSLLTFEVEEAFMFRPSVRTSSLTYSLTQSVRRIDLGDLGWKVDHHTWLSSYCAKALLLENARDGNNLTDESMIADGTKPAKVERWPFALTPEGLLFVFDTESTGCVAWGAHDVLVPYEDLREVIAVDSLLEPLLR